MARRIFVKDVPLWLRKEYKQIGRGSSAIVYEKNDSTVIVARNQMGEMTTDWQFHQFESRDLSGFKELGRCTRIYEMEKLTEVPKSERRALNEKTRKLTGDLNLAIVNNPSYKVSSIFEDTIFNLDNGEGGPVNEQLIELLDFSINYDFQYTKARFDIHAANWMYKKDKLVLVDPFHAWGA